MLVSDPRDGSAPAADAFEPLLEVDEPLSALQVRFGDQARAYRDAGGTAGTRRVYESAFALFRTWCEQRQASPLPADPRTVAFYLTDAAGRYRATTLDLHLAAIAYAHRAAGLPTPTTHQAVREVRTGVRRTHRAPARGKAALMTEDLRRLVGLLDRSPVGLRDRALLLLGFPGAFRRSELMSLDVRDLEFTRAGLIVTLRKSKTDQEGTSRRLGIPYGSSEQRRAALAYTPSRSRQVILLPGCAAIQSTSASEDGSCIRSMTRCACASTRMVPYRRPRRRANSSTPSTRGAITGRSGTARIRRNNTDRLEGMGRRTQ